MGMYGFDSTEILTKEIRNKDDRFTDYNNNNFEYSIQQAIGYCKVAQYMKSYDDIPNTKSIQEVVQDTFSDLVKEYFLGIDQDRIPAINVFAKSDSNPLHTILVKKLHRVLQNVDINGRTWANNGEITISVDGYIELQRARAMDNINCRSAIEKVVAFVIAHELSHLEFMMVGGKNEFERTLCYYVSEYYADIAAYQKMGLDNIEAYELAVLKKKMTRVNEASSKKHPSTKDRIKFAKIGVFDQEFINEAAKQARNYVSRNRFRSPKEVSEEESQALAKKVHGKILKFEQSHDQVRVYNNISKDYKRSC